MKRRIAITALSGALVYGVLLYAVPLFFPLPPDLEQGPPQGLLFLDREDRPVRRMLDGDLRAEEPAAFEEFPESLIEATLAAEDSRFYSHNGIDYAGAMRAVRDALVHRRFVSGASTVTQQTVKLYSPQRDRDFSTKFIEIFSARKLEMFADKRTILTAYLNRLPYGNQYTGARAAARGYFGKPLSDLSIAESALLAGLPNRPTTLNPWKNLEGAKQRQKWILGRMKEESLIEETEYTTALAENLQFLPGAAQAFQAPHFTDVVREQEAEAVAAAKRADSPVRTTLDLDLQRFVESTVAAELTRLSYQSRDTNDMQAAVVVIENDTGEVIALTGSRSFFASEAGQINGAWEPRSAGSTLKPFTYALALEQGYTAATILPDTPIEYITSTGAYQPVNFDRRFNGPVSLRHALANSLNVPAVKLLDRLGGPNTLHHLLSEDLKMTGMKPDWVEYGLGLTLGNAEVRLLELTNAYACLARLGEYRPYCLLRGKSDTETVSVFDPDCAWLIADILSDSQARAEAFGLNTPLDLPFRTACKTGTSTDFRDNWTMGYTPDYTVGVWVGRFNNRPLNQVSGAMGAAPIFRRVMMRVHEETEPRWYTTPPGTIRKSVDRLNGKLVHADLQLPASRTREEWFVNGLLPLDAKESNYTAERLTLLPIDYAGWWRSEGNDLKSVAALEPIRDSLPPFRIVSPLEGTVAFLDPDLPHGGARFPLKVAGSGREDIEWISPSLSIESEGERNWLILQPGRHEVLARDRQSGREVTATFRVEAL